MNALALLKADHRNIEELFTKYEELGDRARGKKLIVDRIVREVAVHTAIEEKVFYPEVRRAARDTNELVLQSIEVHDVVNWLCQSIASMDVADERYDAKMRVLIENMRLHIQEEELQLFPMVREAISNARLNEMGQQLERARKIAPTRPHPRLTAATTAGGIMVGAAAALRRGEERTDHRRGAAKREVGRAVARGRRVSASRAQAR
jgi:hemerythrin superfamily protein